MYIVDVQYFQVPFLYRSFFDHKSHISHKRLPLAYVIVLILENWHTYFIFEKGRRDGHGVAIVLCHFVRV